MDLEVLETPQSQYILCFNYKVCAFIHFYIDEKPTEPATVDVNNNDEGIDGRKTSNSVAEVYFDKPQNITKYKKTLNSDLTSELHSNLFYQACR